MEALRPDTLMLFLTEPLPVRTLVPLNCTFFLSRSRRLPIFTLERMIPAWTSTFPDLSGACSTVPSLSMSTIRTVSPGFKGRGRV